MTDNLDIYPSAKSPVKVYDRTQLSFKGLSVWIKEANFFGRMDYSNQLELVYGNHDVRENAFAKGDRLRLSIKGFKPYDQRTFFKKDNQNEITFHFNTATAIKLMDFLIKNFGMKQKRLDSGSEKKSTPTRL